MVRTDETLGVKFGTFVDKLVYKIKKMAMETKEPTLDQETLRTKVLASFKASSGFVPAGCADTLLQAMSRVDLVQDGNIGY